MRLEFDAASTWREMLKNDVRTGMHVKSYGDGLARISGADVVIDWTAHATEANVWESPALDHGGFGTDRFTAYEDGSPLTRVADVTTCSATPGSLVYRKASDGDPATIQIHASDSGDPNSNGKVYEVSIRESGILLGDNATIEDIHAEKALGAGGAIKVGANSTLRRIVSAHGTKHNIYLGSGLAEDVIAVGCDATTPEEPSSTYFVSHQEDPTGAEVTYRRAFAIADLGGSTNRGTAFIQHGAGNLAFAKFTGEQIATMQAGSWSPSASIAVIKGMFAKNTLFPFGPSSDDGTHDYLQILWSEDTLARQIFTHPLLTTSAINRYRHGVFYDEGSNDGIWRQTDQDNGCTLEISNCTIYHAKARATMAHGAWSSGLLRFNRNIVVSPFGDYPIMVPAGVTYEGDYNVFAPFKRCRYHGVDYATLAEWQAATGQDLNSIDISLTGLFSGTVASGNFRLAGSGSGASAATLLAGPQEHWDWNTHAVAAGPPEAWPVVPATKAEALTYVADPDAWVH